MKLRLLTTTAIFISYVFYAVPALSFWTVLDMKKLGISFRAGIPVHEDITEEGLEKIKTEINGEKVRFTSDAIDEVEEATSTTDRIQSKAYYHVDNEKIGKASRRLVRIRKNIVRDLNKDNPDGFSAREKLGIALHTLQDFYSHTDWIERGNKKHSKRWGKKPMQVGVKPRDIGRVCDTKGLRYIGDAKPGPFLTSGYCIGNCVENCVTKVPKGKCSHGPYSNGICGDDPGDPILPTLTNHGLNKDGWLRFKYPKARKQAIKATTYYVKLLLKDVDSVEGKCALLGITDTRPDLCAEPQECTYTEYMGDYRKWCVKRNSDGSIRSGQQYWYFEFAGGQVLNHYFYPDPVDVGSSINFGTPSAYNSFQYNNDFVQDEYQSLKWSVNAYSGFTNSTYHTCSFPQLRSDVVPDEPIRYFRWVELKKFPGSIVVKKFPEVDCGEDFDCYGKLKSSGHLDQCQRDVLGKQTLKELKSFPGTCQQVWTHVDDKGARRSCSLPGG